MILCTTKNRIAFNVLKQPIDKGGLCIPDLSPNYGTANLTNLVYILNNNVTEDWKAIEKQCFSQSH